MPDLMMETRWVCRSNLSLRKDVKGSKGETYTVEYGPRSGGRYSHDWSCTCPGFKFRGACKHVEAAKADKCDWGYDGFAGGGFTEKPVGGVCPVCGGPVEAISIGV